MNKKERNDIYHKIIQDIHKDMVELRDYIEQLERKIYYIHLSMQDTTVIQKNKFIFQKIKKWFTKWWTSIVK